jgi:hypothetical protein
LKGASALCDAVPIGANHLDCVDCVEHETMVLETPKLYREIQRVEPFVVQVPSESSIQVAELTFINPREFQILKKLFDIEVNWL